MPLSAVLIHPWSSLFNRARKIGAPWPDRNGRLTGPLKSTSDHDSVNYFFLDSPAFDIAIAMACFRGLPAFISVLMFAEITFFDDPLFNGMLPLVLHPGWGDVLDGGVYGFYVFV